MKPYDTVYDFCFDTTFITVAPSVNTNINESSTTDVMTTISYAGEFCANPKYFISGLIDPFC